MSKQETGVYQLPNGNWAYRFVALIDGKKISQKRTTDEFGNKFKTQKSAVKAREKALIAARSERLPLLTPPSRRTISEIYNEYCEKGRLGKAYSTIRKQDSLWKNHLQERFGRRFIDDVTQTEVKDYLSKLYYIQNLSFSYVESFF